MQRAISRLLLLLVCSTICRVEFARAEDFCSSLKQGLSAAGQQFRPLRGNFDTLLQSYKAKIRFGDAASCTTKGDDRRASLRCVQDLGADTVAARAAYRRYIDAAERCLGKDLEMDSPELSTGDTLEKQYEYKPTGDGLRLYLYRLSSADETDYEVGVEISYRDIR